MENDTLRKILIYFWTAISCVQTNFVTASHFFSSEHASICRIMYFSLYWCYSTMNFVISWQQ